MPSGKALTPQEVEEAKIGDALRHELAQIGIGASLSPHRPITISMGINDAIRLTEIIRSEWDRIFGVKNQPHE